MSSSKSNLAVINKWNSLQPREKILLVGAVAVIFVGIVFTVFYSIQSKADLQRLETEKYREALNYVADNQMIYAQNSARTAELREKLVNADPKVVSKLTSMASSLGFDVSVNPKDSHKPDDSNVEEQEIEVIIKSVEYAKLLEYLIEIHKLDTPIFMRRINMTRTSNLNSPDTKMTATITLISYRLKEQNAS